MSRSGRIALPALESSIHDQIGHLRPSQVRLQQQQILSSRYIQTTIDYQSMPGEGFLAARILQKLQIMKEKSWKKAKGKTKPRPKPSAGARRRPRSGLYLVVTNPKGFKIALLVWKLKHITFQRGGHECVYFAQWLSYHHYGQKFIQHTSSFPIDFSFLIPIRHQDNMTVYSL